jgi:hypothetical protein
MERLANFLRVSNSERWMLIKVTCLLGATWVALRIFPFQRVYRWMASASQPGNKRGDKNILDVGQVCIAVNKAGRYFLGADSCFPQALAGEMLLKRNGYQANLRIGVIKHDDGSLRAHAWVESNGVVVIGGPISHVERYTPLPELDNI